MNGQPLKTRKGYADTLTAECDQEKRARVLASLEKGNGSEYTGSLASEPVVQEFVAAVQAVERAAVSAAPPCLRL